MLILEALKESWSRAVTILGRRNESLDHFAARKSPANWFNFCGQKSSPLRGSAPSEDEQVDEQECHSFHAEVSLESSQPS